MYFKNDSSSYLIFILKKYQLFLTKHSPIINKINGKLRNILIRHFLKKRQKCKISN